MGAFVCDYGLCCVESAREDRCTVEKDAGCVLPTKIFSFFSFFFRHIPADRKSRRSLKERTFDSIHRLTQPPFSLSLLAYPVAPWLACLSQPYCRLNAKRCEIRIILSLPAGLKTGQ